MQVLVVCRRRTERFAEAEFAALLDPEAEAVRRLYGVGTLRQAWSRGDVAGAILLLEVADEAAARAALDTLPLYAHGMLEASLIPLHGYRGFGPRG